ncbi:hypothetical protein [Pseudomonas shirazensis]
MENSNGYTKQELQKCPYQSQVYGTNNIDLNYRKAYKGDWGHWDDAPEKVAQPNDNNTQCAGNEVVEEMKS